MELKDQLCSLEQAIKLKELGVLQKSTWYHQTLNPFPGCAETRIELEVNIGHVFSEGIVIESYSAFSVAELGLMIAACSTASFFDSRNGKDCFTMVELSEDFQIVELNYPHVGVDTEAQCRAGLLIERITEGRINVEILNARLSNGKH